MLIADLHPSAFLSVLHVILPDTSPTSVYAEVGLETHIYTREGEWQGGIKFCLLCHPGIRANYFGRRCAIYQFIL